VGCKPRRAKAHRIKRHPGKPRRAKHRRDKHHQAKDHQATRPRDKPRQGKGLQHPAPKGPRELARHQGARLPVPPVRRAWLLTRSLRPTKRRPNKGGRDNRLA
jgi:hypothetical protein